MKKQKHSHKKQVHIEPHPSHHHHSGLVHPHIESTENISPVHKSEVKETRTIEIDSLEKNNEHTIPNKHIEQKQEKTKEEKHKEDHHKREFDLKTEKDIAMEFAMKVHKKFDRIIKASVLFGSQAKNQATIGSDIDIILIVDDASIQWDLELVAWYREELSKLVSADKNTNELHINTIKLTSWWRDLMNGDPVIINILRYGEALIDSGGFFNPIKSLLLQGKIHSTPEAVYAALQRAPAHLTRSRYAEISAIEGIYWSMVDCAQAALMTAGKIPPSPEHIPQLLNQTFVEAGMLKSSHIISIRDIYNLHKSISHGQVKSIKGAEIDKWHDIAERFLFDMSKLIDTLIDSKK